MEQPYLQQVRVQAFSLARKTRKKSNNVGSESSQHQLREGVTGTILLQLSCPPQAGAALYYECHTHMHAHTDVFLSDLPDQSAVPLESKKSCMAFALSPV
eukprot:1152710-Pelagomonas_calceolata.AAC.4